MDGKHSAYIGELTEAVVAYFKQRGYRIHFEGWVHDRPVHSLRLNPGLYAVPKPQQPEQVSA
jgi:hypothetical protein